MLDNRLQDTVEVVTTDNCGGSSIIKITLKVHKGIFFCQLSCKSIVFCFEMTAAEDLQNGLKELKDCHDKQTASLSKRLLKLVSVSDVGLKIELLNQGAKGCCVIFTQHKKTIRLPAGYLGDLLAAFDCIFETRRRCQKSYMTQGVELEDNSGYKYRMELGNNFEGYFMKIIKCKNNGGNFTMVIPSDLFDPMCQLFENSLQAACKKQAYRGTLECGRFEISYWLTYQGCLRLSQKHPLHKCENLGFHKSLFLKMIQVFKDCNNNRCVSAAIAKMTSGCNGAQPIGV
ncbi:protein ORF128 [Lake sturgeon herpesvirus]|nr:protein ORF128 [Lake sturgeon herpesvirus]